MVPLIAWQWDGNEATGARATLHGGRGKAFDECDFFSSISI
jgi:hypothetical protein